jgi:hypothetical protein
VCRWPGLNGQWGLGGCLGDITSCTFHVFVYSFMPSERVCSPSKVWTVVRSAILDGVGQSNSQLLRYGSLRGSRKKMKARKDGRSVMADMAGQGACEALQARSFARNVYVPCMLVIPIDKGWQLYMMKLSHPSMTFRLPSSLRSIRHGTILRMLLSKCLLRASVSVRRFSALTQQVSSAMATERARLPHEDRTAGEPRNPNVHSVILCGIEEVNSNVRLYTLSAKDQDQGIRVCKVSSSLFENASTNNIWLQ